MSRDTIRLILGLVLTLAPAVRFLIAAIAGKGVTIRVSGRLGAAVSSFATIVIVAFAFMPSRLGLFLPMLMIYGVLGIFLIWHHIRVEQGSDPGKKWIDIIREELEVDAGALLAWFLLLIGLVLIAL